MGGDMVSINIRKANEADLAEINLLITDAIMQWHLPERVKRLSVSSFHYDALDMAHMDLQVAVNNEQHIMGVIACEATDKPQELLLHGIFVRPNQQRQGVGKALIASIEQALISDKISSLLVKPQKEALPFFQHMGFTGVQRKSTIQYENLMSKHYENVGV